MDIQEEEDQNQNVSHQNQRRQSSERMNSEELRQKLLLKNHQNPHTSGNENGKPNNKLQPLVQKNKSYDRLSTIKNIQRVNQPGSKPIKLPDSLIKQAAIDQKLNKRVQRTEPADTQNNKQIMMRTEPDDKDEFTQTQRTEKFYRVNQNPSQSRVGTNQQQQRQQSQQQFYLGSSDLQATQRVPRSQSQAKMNNERYNTQPSERSNQNLDHLYLTEKSLSRKKYNNYTNSNNNNSNNNQNIPQPNQRNRIYSSADYRSTYNSGFHSHGSASKINEEQGSPEKGQQTKYSRIIQFFVDKHNTELEEKRLLEDRIQELKRRIAQESSQHEAAMFEASQINDKYQFELSQVERFQSQSLDTHRKKQYEQDKIVNYDEIIKKVQVQNELLLIEIDAEKKLIQEAEQDCKVLKRRSDSQFKQKIQVKKQRNFSLKQISHREFRVKSLTNSTQVFHKDLKDIMDKYE